MANDQNYWFCAHCKHFIYDNYNGEWYCSYFASHNKQCAEEEE